MREGERVHVDAVARIVSRHLAARGPSPEGPRDKEDLPLFLGGPWAGLYRAVSLARTPETGEQRRRSIWYRSSPEWLVARRRRSAEAHVTTPPVPFLWYRSQGLTRPSRSRRPLHFHPGCGVRPALAWDQTERIPQRPSNASIRMWNLLCKQKSLFSCSKSFHKVPDVESKQTWSNECENLWLHPFLGTKDN
ncbi:unnamed protein product [Xylocopa violacea]|uniref:Uncharacterized protein n=1 Tax=Xylocopa violacea TaxID=135666 RepID=A0ABP1P4N4_XYLVO